LDVESRHGVIGCSTFILLVSFSIKLAAFQADGWAET
jgi:hypothetical protein